ADHVARARGRDRDAAVGGEERVAVGRGDELRAGLAVAVGIPAALRLVLAVAPFPFAVLVDLVRGHVDRDAHVIGLPYGVEHVHGAHHVGRVRPHRVDVGAPYQRLGRHVDDDLGALHGERLAHGYGIA